MEKQELLDLVGVYKYENPNTKWAKGFNAGVDRIIYLIKHLDEPRKPVPKSIDDWHEDIGDVLWWDFPITEAPYCGTPLDDNFPDYKTHFTMIECPMEPVSVPKWAVHVGDLVVRKGNYNVGVYLVEAVDADGILLVNGVRDEFFTDEEDRATGEESLSYFYRNFRLLARKENLEEE